MSSKSKRLGSLADIFQAESLEGSLRKIKLSKIKPSEVQPRMERQKRVQELSESLREDGLLQPILVTKDSDDTYKIIAGERRYHAANLLGWQEIECKIFDKNEKETYKLAVIENLQRENLSPYEEVEAMTILKDRYSYSDAELANVFGKSRNYMTEILSINTLSEEEIQTCKNAGIESKNLLVQAVQASKRGDFNTFIDNFQKGEMKTVKDAKSFNKSRSQPQKPNLNQEKPAKSPELKIQKLEKSIVIQSENPELLEETFRKIHSLLKDYV
ncbi:MAG: ParB/RepB/Spo0J family partition protein [Leptospiraceae bacterium]|nr:ParB/RepB/Spo0J family partition protein [Leptospiraceae bacterium]MCP5511069.1 ParB/RepB/Spo0J family partition protein [Leptospiraceae bacterium]